MHLPSNDEWPTNNSGHQLAKAFDSNVNQEPHVRFRQADDGADLSVAQPVLKSQTQNFLLVRRKLSEQRQNLLGRVSLFGHVIGRWFVPHGIGHRFERHRRHALFLSSHVERPVAADREQPLGQMPVELLAILLAEFQERVLNDIPSLLDVPDQVPRIPNEIALLSSDHLPHPLTGAVRHGLVHRASLCLPGVQGERRASGRSLREIFKIESRR